MFDRAVTSGETKQTKQRRRHGDPKVRQFERVEDHRRR